VKTDNRSFDGGWVTTVQLGHVYIDFKFGSILGIDWILTVEWSREWFTDSHGDIIALTFVRPRGVTASRSWRRRHVNTVNQRSGFHTRVYFSIVTYDSEQPRAGSHHGIESVELSSETYLYHWQFDSNESNLSSKVCLLSNSTHGAVPVYRFCKAPPL
jgi:hypothetical protein